MGQINLQTQQNFPGFQKTAPSTTLQTLPRENPSSPTSPHPPSRTPQKNHLNLPKTPQKIFQFALFQFP